MFHLLNRMKHGDSRVFILWIFATFVRISHFGKISFLRKIAHSLETSYSFPRNWFAPVFLLYFDKISTKVSLYYVISSY